MQTSGAEPRPWAPIPGPVDRTTFFEEPRRHRRSTWRLGALCLVAVILMGLVVSGIVTPLLVAQVGVVGGMLGTFLPVPDVLLLVPRGYFDLIEPMMEALDGERPARPGEIARGLALVLLPGIALMLGIWFWLRSLFLRAGVGGMLLALGARTRAALGQVLRSAPRPPGRATAAGDSELLDTLLSERLKPEGMEGLGRFVEPERRPHGLIGRAGLLLHGFRVLLVMPLLFSKLALIVFVGLLVGPLIAVLPRSRRYLADATAVELTRNPDALAAALVEQLDQRGLPPGSQWAAHLFVVGTEVAGEQAERSMTAALRRAGAAAAGKPLSERLAAGLGMAGEARRHAIAVEAVEAGTFADEYASGVDFHPSVRRRLERLRRQGATVDLSRFASER